MFTPVFVYNYFIYREKGILDFPFAQYLNVNRDFYKGSGLAHDSGFVPSQALPHLFTVVKHYFLKQDTIVFLSGVLGFIFLYRNKPARTFQTHFILFLTVFSLIFIAISIVLQTHFTSFSPLFALAGGFFWDKLFREKTEQKKKIFFVVMALFLLWTLFFLRVPLTSTSAVQGVREFTSASIPPESLVVVDARIYSGISAWAFADRHYIGAGYFPQILQQAVNSTTKAEMNVYYIECVPDDCGWGSVKDQPELNQSMEQMTDAFRDVSIKTWDIEGGGVIKRVKEGEEKGETHFRVYQAILPLPKEVLVAVDQTHQFFFYHIPRNQYAERQFDYYTLKTPLDYFISFIGRMMLYFSIILAAGFIVVLIRTAFSGDKHTS